MFWATMAAMLPALAPSPAAACASCGCGDPTITAMGLEMPYTNRVRLAVEERFGGHTAGDADSLERTFTLRSSLLASWSPLSRLTVATLIPLVSEWVQDAPGHAFRGTNALGDIEVSARGVVWQDRRFAPSHLVSLLAGLKTPSGPRAYFSDGTPLDDDLQPGSGSWDPFAGAAYAWFGDKLSGFASAGFRYPTPGRNHYQHGQSFGVSGGLQIQPKRWVALGLGADLKWVAADTAPPAADGGMVVPATIAVAVPDTGGTLLALTPSVVFAPVDRWVIRLAAQIQVGSVNWLNGNQTESHTVMLSTVVDLN
jgi:hypothetical protein